jgi:hypothetical protein
VLLHREDGLGRHLLAGRGAEGAVVHVAAGAARDLTDLGRREPPRHAPVELHEPRKGDVVEIEIEAHADRVGGDEIVDVARLVEPDLGVARTGRKRAQHHGGAAAPPPHQLGQRIDLGRGKADDGAPGRQARDLLRPGIGEPREARARQDLDIGQHAPEQRAHGFGADDDRLAPAARMQQPVGEDMATLGIGAELDLVDGEEIDRSLAQAVERHRLDGAEEVARPRRNDLLLAGDQRDGVGALHAHSAVVVFAGEQAQRKADHARLVREHAFHREMGFAGVGGPEDRGYAALLIAPTRNTNAWDQTVHGHSIRFSPPECKREMPGRASLSCAPAMRQVQGDATAK